MCGFSNQELIMNPNQRIDDPVVIDQEWLHGADLDGVVRGIAAERLRTEARTHNRRGAARFARQDFDAALTELNEALRLDPGLVSRLQQSRGGPAPNA